MEQIKYTNSDGETLTLAKNRSFRLISKSGFETPPNNIETQKSHFADGEIYVSDKLEKRDITIYGEIIPEHVPEYNHEDLLKLRKELIKILNPKKAGVLNYKNDIGEYEIDVLPVAAPAINETQKTYKQPFVIQLVALDPYWVDATMKDRLVSLSRTVNLLEFPLEITKEYEFATIESGTIVKVMNYGDLTVGAIFNIKAYSEVINPRIYDVLKEQHFGFSGTFEAGTEFTIDTRRGKKRVTKKNDDIEENAMHMRLADSVFLQLTPGENYFQVKADEETVSGLIGQVTIQPLVVGV